MATATNTSVKTTVTSRRDSPASWALLSATVSLLAACATAVPRNLPTPGSRFVADTVRLGPVSPGVDYRSIYSETGPWAIHVLEINLSGCITGRAVKGFPSAEGRERTSVLLSRLNDTIPVVAGVNADFFLFTPPGVPVGVHVSQGRVLTRPAPGRPTLGFDSTGAARIAVLRVADSTTEGLALTPFHPLEAVGGRPVVVRDSARSSEANDTTAFAVTRHPRTAAGISNGGRRLLLVVVDGRQPGRSVGVSLAELADLMLKLGAREAINLDGGGSTAMVVASGDSLRLVNRPSDPQGERAVGNALAIVRRC